MNKHEAIYALYPTVVNVDGDKAFDASGNPVPYDGAKVQAKIKENSYAAHRAAEYPSFAEQFDLLFHGGYDAWKSAIKSVKDKYPKE